MGWHTILEKVRNLLKLRENNNFGDVSDGEYSIIKSQINPVFVQIDGKGFVRTPDTGPKEIRPQRPVQRPQNLRATQDGDTNIKTQWELVDGIKPPGPPTPAPPDVVDPSASPTPPPASPTPPPASPTPALVPDGDGGGGDGGGVPAAFIEWLVDGSYKEEGDDYLQVNLPFMEMVIIATNDNIDERCFQRTTFQDFGIYFQKHENPIYVDFPDIKLHKLNSGGVFESKQDLKNYLEGKNISDNLELVRHWFYNVKENSWTINLQEKAEIGESGKLEFSNRFCRHFTNSAKFIVVKHLKENDLAAAFLTNFQAIDDHEQRVTLVAEQFQNTKACEELIGCSDNSDYNDFLCNLVSQFFLPFMNE